MTDTCGDGVVDAARSLTMSGFMIRFDPDADALYVYYQHITPGDVARTEELGDGRQVDYSASGEVLGVEFLGVSHGVNLVGVPRADEVGAALRAFPIPSPA
ncbi:MAG: DUF2283 domain-containing protein [Dehalococcoidia bacterium]|nr:DUF2283 domain-containing protein [Dehalococcoidia bacterium]